MLYVCKYVSMMYDVWKYGSMEVDVDWGEGELGGGGGLNRLKSRMLPHSAVHKREMGSNGEAE